MISGKARVASWFSGEERKVEGFFDRYVLRGLFGTLSFVTDSATVLTGGTLLPVAMATRIAKLTKMGKLGEPVLKVMPRVMSVVEKIGLKNAFVLVREFIKNGGKTAQALNTTGRYLGYGGMAVGSAMIGQAAYGLLYSESEESFELDPEMMGEEPGSDIIEDLIIDDRAVEDSAPTANDNSPLAAAA